MYKESNIHINLEDLTTDNYWCIGILNNVNGFMLSLLVLCSVQYQSLMVKLNKKELNEFAHK